MKYKIAGFLLLASMRMLVAQDNPSAKDIKVDTKIEPVKTTVVVTATRDEIAPDKAPVSASVVTMEENLMRNITSLDQSLNLLNSVYVMRYTQSSSMNKVMMRGFDSAARTLVQLDGQPINDGYNAGVSWASLPAGEVDRIEVARGSFSSLYGGNAMGGVINILTRPITRREVEASWFYGANNTNEVAVRFADQFSKKLAVSVAANRRQTGGYASNLAVVSASTGKTGKVVTGAIPTLSSTGATKYILGDSGRGWSWQEALRAKAEYVFNSNNVANFQYMRQQNGYGWGNFRSFLRDASGNVVTEGPVLTTVNGKTVQLNLTPGSFMTTSGDNYSNWYNGAYRRQFVAGHALQISGGALLTPVSEYVSPSASTATQSSGPGSLNFTDRNSYWGSIQWNGHLARTHSLVAGVETRQAGAGNSSISLSNWHDYSTRFAQTYAAGGQTINQAVYVQDQYRAFEPLTVTLGFRYDYWKAYDGYANSFTSAAPLTNYSEKTSNSVSGKLSAVYSLPASWTIHASVGTSFRPPTVYDLYQTWTGTTGIIYNANPNLSSEKMISEEVGVRKSIARRVDLDVTYYHNHIVNLIYRATDLTKDSSGKWQINQNAGAANTDGIEFSSKVRLQHWLQLQNSYTYTDAVIAKNSAAPDTVGKRVTNVPKHMGAAALFASHDALGGSLTARYVGSTFSSDTNSDTTRGVYGSYGPYFLMDGAVSYQLNKRWEAMVSAENLLDRTYFVYYQQPGRIARIGLRFRM